jgi:hypothetical protein
MEEGEIEFPVSLESIMAMNINYENLKTVLDFIISQLGKTQAVLRGFDEFNPENFVSKEDFTAL